MRILFALFVEKNMIPVYTLLEDAALSLRNEENSSENISISRRIKTGTLELTLEVC